LQYVICEDLSDYFNNKRLNPEQKKGENIFPPIYRILYIKSF